MITVNKIINVTGEGPFTYQWTTDDNCVTFSQATGTTTGQIQTTVYFEDETCIGTATVTLTVTSACGNSLPQEITFTDPCDNFTLNSITYTEPFKFSVTAARPGCSFTSFSWTYDNAVWTQVSKIDNTFQSVLTLTPKTTTLPSTTIVSVKATDCEGCEKTAVYTYTFCTPVAQNIVVNMYPVDDEYVSGSFTIPDASGCSSSIDYDTFSFSLPSGFTATQGTDNVFVFTGPESSSTSFSGAYTVKNDQGITSTTGNITFIYHTSTSKTIFAPNKTFTLDCEDNPGDVVELDLETILVVSSGATVDWSTWQLVLPPTPKSSSITLSTNSQGKHVLSYTIPNPIQADVFSWTIKDTNGIPCDSVTYTVVDCVEAPIGTDDTETVACGSLTEFDVLTNDNGNGSPIDITSVTIVDAPATGTCTVQSDGTILYQAPEAYDGEVTFTYKFKNTSGTWSNDTTVTITIQCAGTDANVILCN